MVDCSTIKLKAENKWNNWANKMGWRNGEIFIAVIPIITKTCIDLQIRRLYLHESNKLFEKDSKVSYIILVDKPSM